MFILTSEQMRKADKRAIERLKIPSLVLMENAARGACEVLGECIDGFAGMTIGVLCGKGNNGGDGLALARHALLAGATVNCALLHDPRSFSPDAAAQYKILASYAPESLIPWSRFQKHAAEYDIIVDAMLGTGASGGLRSPYTDAIVWANAYHAYKFALDIPTGIDADTGLASGICFQADTTATMAAFKPGLLLNEGYEASGDIEVVHIGAPEALYEDSGLEILDGERACAGLPVTWYNQHKYDRGKVLVIAGSRGMTGAGTLTSTASLRSGAGLTVYAIPDCVQLPHSIPPEIMTLPIASEDGGFSEVAADELEASLRTVTTIAMGPGMSRSQATGAFVKRVLARSNIPVVLDADGLFPFSSKPELLRKYSCPLVITPHHGELARLLGVPRMDVTEDSIGWSRIAAKKTKAIVVLKGAPTVIAEPGGKAWILHAGNPGMATGGTGDVLTGVIASVIAQNEGELLESTLTAVWLHSRAADLAVEHSSIHTLTASDVIGRLSDAYGEFGTEV